MAKRKGTTTDAVRGAVDQTFQVAAGLGGRASVTRERAQELVDELTHAAGRVREALDDLRPATGDDLRGLEQRLRRLERRVAELEQGPAAKPKPRARAKPKPKPEGGAGPRGR